MGKPSFLNICENVDVLQCILRHIVSNGPTCDVARLLAALSLQSRNMYQAVYACLERVLHTVLHSSIDLGHYKQERRVVNDGGGLVERERTITALVHNFVSHIALTHSPFANKDHDLLQSATRLVKPWCLANRLPVICFREPAEFSRPRFMAKKKKLSKGIRKQFARRLLPLVRDCPVWCDNTSYDPWPWQYLIEKQAIQHFENSSLRLSKQTYVQLDEHLSNAHCYIGEREQYYITKNDEVLYAYQWNSKEFMHSLSKKHRFLQPLLARALLPIHSLSEWRKHIKLLPRSTRFELHASHDLDNSPRDWNTHSQNERFRDYTTAMFVHTRDL